MKKISEQLRQDIEKAEKQKLNDEEILDFSGGKCAWLMSSNTKLNDDEYCWVDLCCYTALVHPDDLMKDNAHACWSDYRCVFCYHHTNGDEDE